MHDIYVSKALQRHFFQLRGLNCEIVFDNLCNSIEIAFFTIALSILLSDFFENFWQFDIFEWTYAIGQRLQNFQLFHHTDASLGTPPFGNQSFAISITEYM